MTIAKAKYAYGYCDRTGFRYPLNDLVDEFHNGVKTGLRVGRDVADGDHPQNFLGRMRIFDPQSLGNARPDRSLQESRQLFGFDPVWNPAQYMTASVGKVSVNFNESLATVTGVSATASVGTPVASTFTVNQNAPNAAVGGVGTVTIVGAQAFATPNGSSASAVVTSVSVSTNVDTLFTVTVAAASGYGGGNKFYIDGVEAPTGTLNEGSTYTFDQSDSSNSGHPLRFSTTPDGTHGSGVQYTTGVTTNGTAGNAGAYTRITVASGAPTLYYYCTNHSGMGGQANTP